MNIWETHDLTKHFTVRRGFLKQNSFPSWAYRRHAYKAMMLQSLILFLKTYNQSLIFISFSHIDLDAW